MPDLERLIQDVTNRSRERFKSEQTLLSFAQYLQLLWRHPYQLTRSAPQYVADMMDYFGRSTVPGIGGTVERFRVFDDAAEDGRSRVVGQESVQNEFYRALREFIQRRQVDKLILLHGPNGSSKSSFVTALMRGLEVYSRAPEGKSLRFNWIFSESAEKGDRLGFDPVRPEEDLESLAFLEAARISAKIPCELKDNPIFLIPRAERRMFLEQALAEADPSERQAFVDTRFLLEGDLSPKSERIYQSLMKAYGGDWQKVIRHVQVERFYVSRRFRSSAVTIEPQSNIDAHSRQIGHSNMNGLPAVLQNEMLFEAFGDLVDANGGIVEYSDFFKRPIEANKYLLTTAETGIISLPSYTAFLNLVLIGTGNEIYLGSFRRDPIFASFKARLELIRVPYILEYSKESEIYSRQFKLLPREIHVAPHAAKTAGLWAVLTRLLAPSARVDDDRLRRVLERLTPIEKARLYNSGDTPSRLGGDERSLLRAAIPSLHREYDSLEVEFEGLPDSGYEGRRGCSPREMMNLLAEAAINSPARCLSPLNILRAIPDLIADPTLYDYLRIKRTKLGYHDAAGFIEDVRREYLLWLRDDILQAAELVEEAEFSRLFRNYFVQVRAYGTREKVFQEKTGKYADPDLEFMQEIERLLGVKDDVEMFRSNLMTKAAGFKLSHPEKPIVYEELFSESFRLLHENYFRERMKKVQRLVEDACLFAGFRPGTMDDERRQAAERFLSRLQREPGYCQACLAESLEFFLNHVTEIS